MKTASLNDNTKYVRIHTYTHYEWQCKKCNYTNKVAQINKPEKITCAACKTEFEARYK